MLTSLYLRAKCLCLFNLAAQLNDILACSDVALFHSVLTKFKDCVIKNDNAFSVRESIE